MVFGISLEFGEGGFINLDQSEVFVARDGEADSADASVEVEDVFGLDVLFDFLESHLVDREVDLEKAVWRVGIGFPENSIG